ncbi:pleckstrin homology domain-containing family M member 1 isoform X2 [Thrips palmi]|uniref:Pleckstrin homology domain-containing family M member 1 isoform X2 n=1 Tax=Thrips palmi TaxID=161013 RepID=A0A6P9A2M6_THRPL|nr:pleckstrin homology domain-containing family M member 1 isoform X2 [Thrips palmi]
MSQLLRSMRSSLGGRDLAIKNTLVAKLSSCVKDLLVEQADPDSNDDNSSEAVSSLCTALEAIFIHGLKESFIQRVSQAVMSDLDARPDPNFWGPLLEVSHRDVIDEVMKLSLVQTDVGRSRAWLRLALNEGVLSRYLEAMRSDGQRALSHYYRKGALLRDVENLELVQRFLEGIESFPFNLPVNSSLLDVWTLQPLLQAGLWTPPIRPSASKDAVAVATDVAQILEREEQDSLNSDAVSVASFASHNSFVHSPMMALNEEEALKIILGTPVNETPIAAKLRAEESNAEKGDTNDTKLPPEKSIDPASCEESKPESTEPTTEGEQRKEKESEDEGNASMGNSIIGRLGWSSSFEETMSDSGVNQEEANKEKVSKVHSKKKLESYHSLIESYNTASSSGNNLPDLNDFLSKFEPNSFSSPFASLAQETDQFGNLLKQLTKLPHELGLDAQQYTCFGCAQPIGFTFGAPRLCGLTGHYFCDDCTVLSGDEWIVPARVLLNWDYKRYTVSKRAASFLSEIQHHPLLDLKSLNPFLYLTVDEVSELQKLRNQLNLLRAYLFTCREPVIEELQKMVWPREYLYEHVHLYSVSDLLQIPSGILAQHLKHVITFARNHVYNCRLCSQKGFFCEVCDNPKIIYPFDTENTYRCKGCSAVFHATCLKENLPCPKCERRKRRIEDSTTADKCIEV